ncbi:MAG: UDP-N-acetylmuramoyl-L-alanyl-D-glutamate--2,6-diaminopimelate ligase, partial [Planctomycetota bacterium]|nr:UDP-N-acetylmuramoyl-L-alanyl-D-glutamate--2,6-diaminopimelate ligase [Planctomycetota bacterium]
VPAGVPLAVVPNTRQAVGPIAQAFHDWPARKLTCVGVTGTNGKTTVTTLIRAILARAGHRAGLVGTIAYHAGSRDVKAAATTPDPITLAQLCAEMIAAGQSHLVMEVSSHALDQGRTSGLAFAAGVFTNLTGDHLDYHGTMEAYKAAKLRLFAQLDKQAAAVINRDDAAAEDFLAAASGAGTVLSYGLNATADLWARIGRIDAAGTRFTLTHAGTETEFATSLIGRHNVYNCLAATGAGIALGVPMAAIAAALGETGNVRGRLERVDVPAPYSVFVDYAHTDDALRNVLSALRPLLQGGRVIVVFGCGGDRDRTKRPRMAAVAQDLADRIIVTSDNPRSERPEAIIEEILAGLSEQGRRRTDVQIDRRAAIEQALALAAPGDIVLIAGKGHETEQVVGSQRLHFDDVETAAEVMRRREGGCA